MMDYLQTAVHGQ